MQPNTGRPLSRQDPAHGLELFVCGRVGHVARDHGELDPLVFQRRKRLGQLILRRAVELRVHPDGAARGKMGVRQ